MSAWKLTMKYLLRKNVHLYLPYKFYEGNNNAAMNHNRWAAAFGSTLIALVVFARYRLLPTPLERDEGEYAYMAQLILKGIPPYAEAFNMKWPGVYYCYAGIMGVFGQTGEAVHLGLLTINLISTWLVYRIAFNYFGVEAAFAAAASFLILTVAPGVLGFAGHATHFVTLFALAGFNFLMGRYEFSRSSIVLAGIAIGLSGIMKQHGILFTGFGIAYLLLNHTDRLSARISNAAAFTMGALVPVMLLFFGMYLSGVFDSFWFWTIEYALNYEKQKSIMSAYRAFLGALAYVSRGTESLWVLGIMSVLVLVATRDWTRGNKAILLFTCFGFLTILPGFYFRPHYFIPLLPGLALLISYLYFCLTKLKVSLRIYLLCAFWIAMALPLLQLRHYFFLEKPSQVIMNSYGHQNSFGMTKQLGERIKTITGPDDKVFVFGSEPQIYFYSQRHASTGYLYMYPFKEVHPSNLIMQQDMIREVEANLPEVIVNIHTVGSWGRDLPKYKLIREWYTTFLKTDYERIDMYSIPGPGFADSDGAGPEQFIEVLRKRQPGLQSAPAY
jgi:hypothetical protein